MRSLLFFLLAGCAVRCDDSSYYVIQVPENDPVRDFTKTFKVYWNVPTMQCASKRIPFDNLYEKYGILQNSNDSFRGEKISILYDPGLFPALLKNESSGKFKFRNGGVPQEGDLDKHLDAFRIILDQSIPEKGFSGVGIIDFESWRPVFRQNFGVLVPYKDVSYELEKKIHWWWPKAWIQAEAKQRFEEAARQFMQKTIVVAKQMRPNALWGYYGFPYCFNMGTNNLRETCADKVPEENDRTNWLWSASTALYPSLYSSTGLSSRQLRGLVRGRVREAARAGGRVLPYLWYRYRDGGYMREEDVEAALQELYDSEASGFIIWGSSNDVNTVTKCNKLLNYIENVFGPAVAKYTKPNMRVQDEMNTIDSNKTGISDITTTTIKSIDINSEDNVKIDNNLTEINNVTSTIKPILDEIKNETNLQPDPDYNWDPPENYTQDIKHNVEEEILRKTGQNITVDVQESIQNVTLIDTESFVLNYILRLLLDKESKYYKNSTNYLESEGNSTLETSTQPNNITESEESKDDKKYDISIKTAVKTTTDNRNDQSTTDETNTTDNYNDIFNDNSTIYDMTTESIDYTTNDRNTTEYTTESSTVTEYPDIDYSNENIIEVKDDLLEDSMNTTDKNQVSGSENIVFGIKIIFSCLLFVYSLHYL